MALGLIIVLFFALPPAPYTVEMATIAKTKFSQEVAEDGRKRARNVYVVTASGEAMKIIAFIAAGIDIGASVHYVSVPADRK